MTATVSDITTLSSPPRFASQCMPQPVAITDRNGKIVWANGAFEQLIQVPSGEACGASLMDRLRQQGHGFTELQSLIKAYDEALSTTYLAKLRGANDSHQWFRISIAPDQEQAGQDQCYYVSLLDVTEIEQLKQSIAQTKQQNAMLFECVNAGMGEWNLKHQTLQCGPLVCKMLGDLPGAWDNQPASEWLARCHAEDAAALHKVLTDIRNGNSERIQTEFRVRHQLGYWIHFLARGQVNKRDAQGDPLSVSLVFIDVTELRHLDTRWHHRAKLSADWFWSTDASGNLSEISSDIERLLACDLASMIDRPLFEGLKRAGARDAHESHFGFLQTQQAFKGNLVRIDKPEREPTWVEFDATPRYSHRGEFQGFEGVARDVTIRRKQELQLLEAKQFAEHSNKSKSLFLAAMSHEIRTPMNGVLGMAEMLATTELDEDQTESLNIIRRSASHLLTLIDSILDFSKLDADRVEIEARDVHPGDVVYSVAENLLPVAHAKGVRLRAFSSPSLPRLSLDDTRLRQVLNNLVGNAIKFSAKEGRNFGEVYVRAEAGANNRLLITISDNGIGIAENQLHHIFEAFSQAEVSTTRRYGGTGLGLAISKRLIELMQGEINVRSTVNQGSVFSVSLPMSLVSNAIPSRGELKHHHCVIVGADSDENSDLKEALTHGGATVRLASDVTAGYTMVDAVKRPTIYIHNAVGPSEPSYIKTLKSHQWPADVTHLLVTDGTRKSLRMIDEKIACADWGRAAALVNAVSILSDDRSQLSDQKGAVMKRQGQVNSPKKLAKLSSSLLVLVAEDDPINQRVISKQLSHIGVRAEFAKNGREALDMWQKNRQYSLILTDLHMPEMDGYELTRSIRAQEGAQEHISIIALTANAVTGETMEAYEAGIDLYLTKPILLDDLQTAVATFALDHTPPGTAPVEEAGPPMAFMNAPDYQPESLRALLGDDAQGISELIEHYISESPELIDGVKGALQKGDLRTSKVLSHRLKSASKSVGALRLGEIFTHVEGMVAPPTTAECASLCKAIESSFDTYVEQTAASLTAFER
jgi:signal transduction histidine kinase/ActR/RegA family two-component response regulator/HPt (histidine-containing phosphotransfer) domain-containing protein